MFEKAIGWIKKNKLLTTFIVVGSLYALGQLFGDKAGATGLWPFLTKFTATGFGKIFVAITAGLMLIPSFLGNLLNVFKPAPTVSPLLLVALVVVVILMLKK